MTFKTSIFVCRYMTTY